MSETRALLRGLDSPQHLRAWMEAAGREYLVLRVADVLGMLPEDQRLLLNLIAVATRAETSERVDDARLRTTIQRLGWSGYVRIPRDAVCSLSLGDLEILQQWLSVYREVRLGKGEPSRVDPCEDCGGSGKRHGIRCDKCLGEGEIVTFLEISEEESDLSSGALIK